MWLPYNQAAVRTMRFEPLVLSCDCGRPASTFAQVGLTPEREIVFHWWCADCGEPVYVIKSLAECWRECPPKQNSADKSTPAASSPGTMDLDDIAFLGMMGIKSATDSE